MSSIISAGITSGTAIGIVGDASGQLVLQTNGSTTALTLDTSQNAIFVGKVTSAGALVLGSNGTTTAVTISTGQVVTLAQALPIGSGGTGATTLAGANIALLNVAQTWTAPQRGTITVSNTGSFNQNTTNNFQCTPAGAVTLTFTNHTAGQSGYVLLINTGGYAITAAATTKLNVAAGVLAYISSPGTYVISYIDNGTNAYITTSGALA